MFDRRDLFAVLGLVMAWAAAPGGLCADETEICLPSILFILADDMGYGDLACQNPDSKIPTPHLDRLAKEGMLFTDAHSPSAVCTPTRYGILTGRYCWRTELKSGVLGPWDRPLIEPDRLTLPTFLKRHGYETACIGKWHLGWDWQGRGKDIDFSKPIPGGPTSRGFDYYFGTAVPNYPPYCFIENDRTIGIPSEEKPKSMFGHPGPMLKGWKLEEILPALTRKAVEYIKADRSGSKDKPFFLYLSLTAPHTPIAPTFEFRGKSKAGAYGDFVHQVDASVGQVLKTLDESGLAESTLVLFTSDNGSPGRDGTSMCGVVNSVRKFGHNPSHVFRGIKADVWDGGHRVPFIARWPGYVKPGSKCDELVCHIDLMATCAALLGFQLPDNAGEDSCDILPAFRGEVRDKPIREALVHHSGNGMFAIRNRKWKLILGRGSGGWSGSGEKTDPAVQLYDMSRDASETGNLCDQHPDVVERMTQLLEKYKHDGRSRGRR